MNRLDALVVSVFPRGEPAGEPALVALEPESLDVLSYREFPPSEFLENPANGMPGAVRHARGLARKGNRLFVSLFNAVGEYEVADPVHLDLSLKRRLTAPAAADLHGISLAGERLAAASTGGDCVLAWDLESGACRPIEFGGSTPPAVDIRFPGQSGETATIAWRDVLPGRSHLNDVALKREGLIACSLSRIVARCGVEEVTLAEHQGALFHDAQLIDDDELLVTDGARGEIVLIDLRSLRREKIVVSDPGRWFVRGIEIIDGYAYVLRSQVVENRQTNVGPNGRPRRWGATFGVSIVELRSRCLVAQAAVALPDAPAGSVAYQLVAWPARP